MKFANGVHPTRLSALTLIIGSVVFSAACEKRIEEPRELSYELIKSTPHQTDASTQGLLIHDGVYYESTGVYGESTIRRVDPESGEILKRRYLATKAFGEGLALRGDRLYQLEWQSGEGFIYHRETLEKIGGFSYEGEGWGLTSNEEHFVLSDGTSTLRFLDPDTFEVVRRVIVRDHRGEVDLLNELEWIDGKVWANRWHTDDLVVIDPRSGVVEATLNLFALERPRPQDPESVLNGIAFDTETGLIHVTGKRWPRVHRIRVLE
ncbi:MAG: glutaminyl-peptide cyclotransferase [Verrucomicrobiota bacterium]